MFVLTLIFYFKSKSKRNLVAKVATKPEFLVAEKPISDHISRNFELS